MRIPYFPSPGVPARRPSGGFSLIEILFTLIGVAILTGIALDSLSDQREKAAAHKLRADVSAINRAVRVYQSFGGSIEPGDSEMTVLARLQSHADAVSAEQTAGLTGNMIDSRLRALMQSGSEAGSTQARALWNFTKSRFEIATSGAPGVKRFILDEGIAGARVDMESRTPSLKLATRDPWVWDYREESPLHRRVVTPIPLIGGAPSPLPPLPPVPPVPPVIPPGPMNTLVRPLFSIPSGAFPISAYDLSVSLTDPNPAGKSRILYSVNGSGWAPYTGAPLELTPASVVRAFAESIDPEWLNSGEAANVYEANAEMLVVPLIHASAPRFDYAANQRVSVTIVNPNDSDVSALIYHLPGIGWQQYFGTFQVSAVEYRGGVEVMARAVPTAEYYGASHESAYTIGGPGQQQLLPPDITLTPTGFGSENVITLSIENPNPEGSSDVDFKIVPVPSSEACELLHGQGQPTGFVLYSASMPLNPGDLPQEFAVIGYARSVHPGYVDSGFALTYAKEHSTGLRGGHFDVDTSSFIAEINGGSTDGHVHAYDNKYDTNVLDFFNLLDGKLHNIDEDITSPLTKFKLIVVNADLTPSARFNINQSLASAGIPVTAYDNTGIESLPVYSLGGVPGTIQLDQLKLYFERGAITEASVIPSNTGDVRKNVPGKNGEWRNGALTIQAVRVNDDGTDAFTTAPASSAGSHGPASNALLWETTIFWHWKGDSYHEAGNGYIPYDPTTVDGELEGGDEEPVCAG